MLSHPDLAKGKSLRQVKDDLLTSSKYIVDVLCQLSLGGPIGADVSLCWMQKGLAYYATVQLCCNVGLVFFVSMELLSALVWEPVQPTDGPLTL